jgi:hypothetical protein
MDGSELQTKPGRMSFYIDQYCLVKNRIGLSTS